VAEAGITLAALRVEDPEGRPTPRRPIAIARDQRLRSLPDDIASKTDPRAPGQFDAEPGRSGDGRGQTTAEAGRFEHDEERLRAPGERGQPAEPIGDPGWPIRGGQPTTGQIEDEQVHRAAGQQHAPDGEPLIEGLRGDDDEPLQVDAAGDGLDRVEAAREVEPGHDRTLGLGFRGEPQDERRPATRTVTTDRDTRRAWQAAGAQDRVERREPGVDDAVVRVRAGGRRRDETRVRDQGRGCRESQRQGTIRDPRSCGSPASLEARHGCRHVRG
jgi:hypothetical protein